MKWIFLLLFLTFQFLSACKYKNPDEANLSNKEIITENYPNGIYCADIAYFNPNTSTEKNYTLNVEVENNRLTKIYWSNGGWLDETHFSPPELNDNGRCSFTSDKGKIYTVRIIGDKCNGTTGNPEPDITLGSCAASIGMTEDELLEYEGRFNQSRFDAYSEDRCNDLKEYIFKIREIKSKMDALKNDMENGKIVKARSRVQGGILVYQYVIVKKLGIYFLFEIDGEEKMELGNMEFNHETGNWQLVTVKDRNAAVGNNYQARIIKTDSDLLMLEFYLDDLIENR